mgnify:CR=1 FL=1
MGKIGAFLDWGLEKDLLLPFKQQRGAPFRSLTAPYAIPRAALNGTPESALFPCAHGLLPQVLHDHIGPSHGIRAQEDCRTV